METEMDSLIQELRSLHELAKEAEKQHEKAIKELGRKADAVLEQLRAEGFIAHGGVTYGFELKLTVGKGEERR